MAGMGTLINVAGIIAGGLIGLMFGKLMTKRFQETLTMACGICVLFIGIGGAMEYMLSVTDGKLSSGGSMMIIGCFVLG